MTFHTNGRLRRQFARNANAYFLGKIRKNNSKMSSESFTQHASIKSSPLEQILSFMSSPLLEMIPINRETNFVQLVFFYSRGAINIINLVLTLRHITFTLIHIKLYTDIHKATVSFLGL